MRDSNTALVSNDGGSRGSYSKCGVNLMTLVGLVMAISVVFSLFVFLRNPLAVALSTRNRDFQLQKGVPQKDDLTRTQGDDHILEDNPLADLLPTGFDKNSCHSRYESLLYHHGISKKPSPYLVSRLRNYEALHKKCGLYTDLYNKTVEDLKFGRYPMNTSDCKYIVWIPLEGMGNRILTLASTFLYALLTNRVLLVHRGVDIHMLFCDPFPDSSWLLPLDFPMTNQFSTFNKESNESFGNMIKSNSFEKNSLRPYMYVYLVHDYEDQDKLFFCDQDKAHVQNTPWLIVKSDYYFILLPVEKIMQ